MYSLPSSRPVFTILTALTEGHAGLHYGPDEQELYLERVAGRATEVGFTSLLDYYYYLKYDPAGPAELDRLIDALVVNETFFFRELQPLKMLVKTLVAPMVVAGRRPKIWSAACSTGEEPLTLAMLLADAGLLDKVDLVASDVSPRVLERAKNGRFGRRALRDVPEPGLAQRWLREEAGGLQVAKELREAISWRRINLCKPAELPLPGSVDLVLCRNVLIYFTDQTAARVIESLTEVLRPRGVLCVGISESLLRFGSSLVCEEIDRVFVYRRPA